MRPRDLVIRCYAERLDGQWQAFCIDFDLAAQGDSLREVREKMRGMVEDYVRDATVGPDRDFAAQFLNRRAPLALRFRYWCVLLVGAAMHGTRRSASGSAAGR